MTAPDPPAEPGDVERRLTRRIQVLETDLFQLSGEVRRAAQRAERAADGMDDLEDMITDADKRVVEQAVAAMEAVMRQRQLALDTDSTTAHAATARTDQQDSSEDAKPARPDLNVLQAWVEEHIGPLVRKTTTTGEGGGIRWCRSWWRHRDAVERFTALHIVHIELSEQNTLSWLSAYLRDHLDPHLAILTSPIGPFYACTPSKHSDMAAPLGTVDAAESGS